LYIPNVANLISLQIYIWLYVLLYNIISVYVAMALLCVVMEPMTVG